MIEKLNEGNDKTVSPILGLFDFNSNNLKEKWMRMTEVQLHKDKLPKCYLPCAPYFIKKEDIYEDARKEIAKIYKNWDRIVEIAASYDLLLDFVQEYRGPCLALAKQKIFEYHQFLTKKLSCHDGSRKIFKENDKFWFGNGEDIYFNYEYKQEFKKYYKIKRGSKSDSNSRGTGKW